MEQPILDLILKAADDLNAELDNRIAVEKGKDAPLYGEAGVLDSLQLVSLVVAVEQAIQDKFGKTVTLADEKALSMSRSPFRTIGSLTEYALRLLPSASA